MTKLQAIAPLALVGFVLLACSEHADGPLAAAAAGPSEPGFSVGAGPPQTGSGSGMITSLEILSSRDVGPNRIQERTITGVMQGALQGTFVEHARGVIHATGLVTYQGRFEFTGTVEGCDGAGTLTASLSGRGEAGLPVTEASFRVIDQATSTLRVAGTGTMQQVGPLFTYEVRYVCR
jgi:hypothetical protein